MSKFSNIPPEIARKLDESLGRIRRILCVRGVCATLAVLVASVLGIMAIDAMVTIYSSWVRWILWAAGLVATSAVGWFALVKPLRRKFTASEIALLIERNHPELEERLSTVVELALAGDVSASDSLMTEITKDAVKDVGMVSPKKEFTGRTVKPRLIAAAIALGILAVLFALFPKATLRLATRALVPSAEVDNVYASSLKVTPGDQTVLEGSALTVNLAVEAGFPSRAFVRTRPDGKGEAVERMNCVSEEGAKGPVFYQFNYPRVSRSFTYRMNCGSALTRAYRVEVVPEPTYLDRFIEIVHPEYTGRKPEHYTNTANVVGLAGSKVRMSAKPARVGVTGEARLPGDRIVSAEMTEDGRMEFGFVLAPETEGSWSTVAWDTHGFTNQVDVGGISVVKDTPPEVKLTYPEEAEVRLPKVGSLPMQFAVKDDFGLKRVVLERCVGVGAWQESEEVAVRKAGDVTWDGDKTVYLLSQDLGDAGMVRFRIKVEDNLPAGLGGPGVAYTSEVMVNMVQKRDAEKNGKSLGEQALKKEIEEGKKAVQDIAQHLRRAQQSFQSAAGSYAQKNNGWHQENAARASGAAKDAMVNAEALMADMIDGFRAGRLDTGVEIFTPVQDKHIVPIRQGSEDVVLLARPEEKSQSSSKLAKDVDAALKALEQARKRFDILSQKAEELQRLEDLAEREKALAELAEKKEISAEELANSEEELLKELKEEIKDDLVRNLDKQKEEAEKLAKKGEELKKRQEEIEKKAEAAAESKSEEEFKKVAKEEKQLAKEIEDLANKTRDLTESIEKEAGSPEMDPKKTSEPADTARAMEEYAKEQADQASEKMEKGEFDSAKENTESVKDALNQAQQQLNEAQNRIDEKNKEFSETAQEYQEMADSLQEAAEAARAAAEEEQQSEQHQQQAGQSQNGEQQQSYQQQQQDGQNQDGQQQEGEQQQQQDGQKQDGQQQQQQGQQQQQQGQQQQQQGQQQQQQGQQQQQQGPAQQQAQQKAQNAAQKMKQQAQQQAQQNNFDMEQFQNESESEEGGSQMEGSQDSKGKPGKPSAKPSKKGKKGKAGKAFTPDEDPNSESDWFKMKSDSSADAESDGLDNVPAEYRGLVREYFNALNTGDK